MAKPLKAHEIAVLSKVIGRPLRPHEISKGKLDTDDATPFDQEILDAQKRVDDKQILDMSPEERNLEFAKQSRQQHLNRQADAKAVAAHRQKVAPRVAELKKLQAAAANDPAYDAFDKAAIEKAINFLELGTTEPSLNDYKSPSIGDPQIADALYVQVSTIVSEKNAAKKETLTTKRLELEKQRIALEAELASLEPEKKPVATPWTKESMDAAFANYKAVKAQHGEQAPETVAALEAWGVIYDQRPQE